jgi:hypothetical protein
LFPPENYCFCVKIKKSTENFTKNTPFLLQMEGKRVQIDLQGAVRLPEHLLCHKLVLQALVE